MSALERAPGPLARAPVRALAGLARAPRAGAPDGTAGPVDERWDPPPGARSA